MTIDVEQYLNKTFPGLTLTPSLYQQWDIGIHVEFGAGFYQWKDNGRLNLARFHYVYHQALAIFNEIFSYSDEILLVTNVYQYKPAERKKKRIKVYNRYIKNKELKYHLKQQTLPYVLDDEDVYISRFSLKCRKQDIHYVLLIKAACNEDFRLKPKFGTGYNYPDVFFINLTKNVIFFIYDDRGCEVIATNKETIKPLGLKFRNWIDNHK